MIVQTMVRRDNAGWSGGADKASSVDFPQWGQSVDMPMASAGNSMRPPQCEQSPFK
jgi:hypothetical protein